MAFAQPGALTRDQVASFEFEVDAIRADVMNRRLPPAAYIRVSTFRWRPSCRPRRWNS